MTNKLMFAFLLPLLVWTGSVYSAVSAPKQDPASGVSWMPADQSRVNPSVRKFLRKHPDLSSLRASCTSFEDCMAFEYNGKFYTQQDYESHVKEYPLEVSKGDLLNTFLNAAPGELWVGDCQFQLSYNHSSGKLAYQDDERGKLQEGELILVEIRIKLGNMLPVKRATAFEILSIDPETGDVSFSYTAGMRSKGIQCISVRENGEHCIVTHTTKYLSGSEFRDKTLYVKHHEKLLEGFYSQLESLVHLQLELEKVPGGPVFAAE